MADIPEISGSDTGTWKSILNTIIGLINGKINARPYLWANAAARTAQTGMSEGEIGDQADTNHRWRYSGSTWVDITTGSSPVIPSASPTASAGSVSQSADGVITLSAAGTVIGINGCFSTAYRCYDVTITWTASTGTNDIFLRLRSGTTDLSANSSYAWSRSSITSGTAAQSLTGSTTAALGNSINSGRQAALGGFITFKVLNPMVTGVTGITGSAHDTVISNTFHGTTFATTQYDGFSINTAGTLTGIVTVIGYN